MEESPSVRDARTLLVSRSLPLPVRGGADLRVWQVVNALLSAGPVAVFGLHSEPPADPPAPGIELWRTSTVPGLTDAPGIDRAALDWLREPRGHPSDRWFSENAADELAATAEEFRPDVVVVDHLWLHRYIEPLRKLGHRVVLNTHNVEGALQADMATRYQHAGGQGLLLAKLHERIRAIEAAAVAAVDQVWVCSEEEARLIADSYEGCADTVVVPNSIDVESYGGGPDGDRDRAVIYPGVFMYPPNSAAAGYLIDEVFPLLTRSAPSAKLVLMGRSPTPAMLAAAERDPRIAVTGPVPDARPYLAAASAMAVPLFEGGGTRFKVLEAFASRLPVVSTQKGVEGLEVEPDEHFLRAETPPEFVAQLERLWTDPPLRDAIAEPAHALVRERYSWQAAAERVRDGIAAVLS